jgi:DNA invertase Pin-like site-specific DNA recombinase
MIVERVKAGLKRATAEGIKLGRPKVSTEVEHRIREQLALGLGIRKVARMIPCGTGTVQRVKAMTLAHASGSGNGAATGGPRMR